MTSEQWDERYSAPRLVWSAAPNRFLVAEVEAMAPGRALDVACGEGRNAVWLATRGWNVTGADFSPVGIGKARQLAAEHDVDVTWEVVDITTRRWPDAAFDLVIVFYLHMPPDAIRSVLRHAQDALAPGGTLLVVGHALRNLTDGYGGPPTADGLYGPDDLVAGLDGLTIERAEEVLRPVEADGETHTAIDVLVRARRSA
ncbi:MAG: class I SAM-dependent methyltransferase [Acidimicrobiia bacterium]|nr:class I SAM-dependent methyltransferase [Acidimicrobiia bacterium]MBT8246608.1 class I SAM-dependent methyltransferase [Acidimicrobiia bacterium]NNF88878.1 class I SAM-dependent methyltransferase [Acidimicrobiia bacterium]NNJ46829.1 class I SAM-dependent methyltransferase [Acidimicrobiia bacterium]NNL98529.1 class I SAM-dependent methyltransferase [Acidimicrobiia bacterium]